MIHPGEFVLGRTEEHVTLPADIVARIEGKSSLGRLGLIVHATAGFVDPGFSGSLTLEITNFNSVPIVLRAGLPIARLPVHDARPPGRTTASATPSSARTTTASRGDRVAIRGAPAAVRRHRRMI